MVSIAFFNNKGGVGKTTLLCNFASFVQQKLHKKVLVVDADPQCNTTSYVLDDDVCDALYNKKNDQFTIYKIMEPLQDGLGYVDKEKVKPILSESFGFMLIPGNPRLSSTEDFLARDWSQTLAGETRGVRSTLVFSHFLSLCNDYDFVFFDMGPSLGAINRSILLACEYFITPMSADIFSLLALENIGESVSKWREDFNNGIVKVEKSALDRLPEIKKRCDIKFIGFVEQQYIKKTENGAYRPVQAYEDILQQIPSKIIEHIVNPINKEPLMAIDYKIGSIPNYHSLVPMSQSAHKPIFNLSGPDGIVGAHYRRVKDYEELMKEITEKAFGNLEIIKNGRK
ncbi:ParA family protein [Faecalibaculum rodentium]|uniref:ParA family protein n=1 Tax=Faecalibaculum rodentium TaxID=1702221 RepID=UPI002626E76F|nr:ParA family protein [Faecalibaculum rodentium]